MFLTGSVNPSILLKSSRRLWLNLRFFTGLLISPFSTRNVPSRVIPVRVFVRGSTFRIAFSVERGTRLERMVDVIHERHIVTEYLLIHTTGQVASSLTILPHSEVRRESGAG